MAQISTSEMLSKIDEDKITFQRAPLIDVPSQIRDMVLEKERSRYPNFKDSMWYYAYVKDNGYTNAVHYDWGSGQCLYFTLRDEALKTKSADATEFIKSQGKAGSSDAKKEIIPVKYCEKIYNFYSKK